MESWRFFKKTVRMVFVGTKVYYLWCIFLLAVIGVAVTFYLKQLDAGLIVTNMRDQVSWGLYIGNFTYLVGVAAAAVLLVIPAYIYHFDPIKEIVVLGELLAASAIIMALLFVIADMGRPDRFWHLIPLIGILSFPDSLLAWDVVVLNGYLVLNTFVPIYILVKTYFGKEPNRRFVIPLVLLSIPWAVGIHTVTAFLYNGLAARPFWNASILAPRFLASAFCSGPAMAIIIFQILRKTAGMKIKNEALFKISELMAYAMFINLFLLGAELFKEYYSGTIHLAPMEYLYQGLHGHQRLGSLDMVGDVHERYRLCPLLDPENPGKPCDAQYRLAPHHHGGVDREGTRAHRTRFYSRSSRGNLRISAEWYGDSDFFGDMGLRASDLYPLHADRRSHPAGRFHSFEIWEGNRPAPVRADKAVGSSGGAPQKGLTLHEGTNAKNDMSGDLFIFTDTK